MSDDGEWPLAHGVAAATSTVTRAVLDVTTSTVDSVSRTVDGIATDITTGASLHNYSTVGRAARRAHTTRREFRASSSLQQRLRDYVSPAVVGHGGDFATKAELGGKEPVILRLEITTSAEVKAMAAMAWLLGLFALASAIAITVLKVKYDGYTALVGSDKYFVAAMSVAAICLALLLIQLSYFVHRLLEARASGRVWSQRRRRMAGVALTATLLQITSSALMITTDALVLPGYCQVKTKATMLLGFFQWTITNTLLLLLVVAAHMGSVWRGATAETVSTEPGGVLVIDAPLSVHAPKLLVWLFFQCGVASVLGSIWTQPNGAVFPLCQDPPLKNCQAGTRSIGFTTMAVCATLLYLAGYVYCSWRTDADIKARPYTEMRFARVGFGVLSRQVTPVFVFLVFSVALLFLVEVKSCWSYAVAWLGMIPMQAIGSCMAFTLCFYYMPKSPSDKDQVLQSYLQEFAWTLSSLPARTAARNAHVAKSQKLAREPMFCVETAIKLLYFSELAYSLEEPDQHAVDEAKGYPRAAVESAAAAAAEDAADGVIAVEVDLEAAAPAAVDGDGGEQQETASEGVARAGAGSLDVALSLYDTQRWELFWDRETDTKALLAWNQGTLVVAFKGTSSFENVLTDLDLFKTAHLPIRSHAITSTWGARLIRTTVKVHRGFYAAWTHKNYHTLLLERVAGILGSMACGGAAARVLVTGHSLGGAVATLAAYAIKTAHPSVRLAVYTFGEPRVGNRAWAKDYDDVVGEHFHVINDQDPVPRIPKGSYKRVGNRVIMTEHGDILARPSYLEMSIINTAAGDVSDHMLEAYRHSLMTIVKEQFKGRGVEGGREGAAELATHMDLNVALMGINLSIEALEDVDLEPVTAEEVVRREFRRGSRLKLPSFTVSLKCGGGARFGAGCGGCGCGGHNHEHDEEEEAVKADTSAAKAAANKDAAELV